MDVQISSYPPLRVASVEHRGAYDNIGEAFGRLGAIARPSGLLADPAAAMVALYYDDPQTTPVAELRSEAGLVVSEHTRLPAGLTERRIAGGRYARTVHRGPYTNLGDAWARLMSEWLPSSGQRAANSPSFELYLNDPTTTAAADLLTELRLPLEGD